MEQRVFRKVDKIVGPGNIFEASAKKAVYGYVSIDLSQDRVRSWFLQMRQQIQDMLQQIFCPRQSMTSLPPRS